jgi:hypothetical protein
MRYYLYISGTKVEMLFEQIPTKRLNKISANLGINLGFITAGFQTETYAGSLSKKIDIIEKYLKNKTGSILNPNEYIADEGYVKWGPYDGFDDLVYFAGEKEKTGFALGGSMRNCLGNGNRNQITSYSLSSFLVSALVKKRAIRCTSPAISTFPHRENTNERAIEAIEYSLIQDEGPENRVRFLAKKLLDGHGRVYEDIWLGTPIYVELAK